MPRSIRQPETRNQQPETKTTKRQRGQALTEFGLILPAFLLLTVGIIDFGRGVWAHNTLAQAVREATRYAATNGAESPHPASASKVREIVEKESVGLDPTRMTVTTSWQPDNRPGSAVRVQAQYAFTPVLPFIPQNAIVLRSTSRLVISR